MQVLFVTRDGLRAAFPIDSRMRLGPTLRRASGPGRVRVYARRDERLGVVTYEEIDEQEGQPSCPGCDGAPRGCALCRA